MRILIFLSSVILLFNIAFTQNKAVERWHLGIGTSFPSAPEQFYDYWGMGYQLSVGAQLVGSSKFFQVISADVNFFPFDEARLRQRLGISDESTTVSGASTYILNVSYLIKYTFSQYVYFKPTFYAGAGLSYDKITSAEVHYPNYSVTQDGKSKIFASIPFGLSINILQEEGYGLDVAISHTLSLASLNDYNTNFTTMKVSYSFAP